MSKFEFETIDLSECLSGMAIDYARSTGMPVEVALDRVLNEMQQGGFYEWERLKKC